ncbi:MAG: hypothetical protein J6J79_02025 [Lachnospiraceae bacterium]|nr:hypothetical protein [Lachnospiraceae bacterium]
MADNDKLLMNGYRFGSEKDAKTAEEEIKLARYFETRMTGKSGRNRLAVYDQLLDKKVFRTPLGWEYLRHLQEELQSLGISEEEIRPIPMYMTFVHDAEDADRTPVRERIRPARPKSRVNKYHVSVLINIILVIMVIAMFAITLNSDNPNILNYKNNIINQYASWEQELTERENKVREKENSLQMNVGEELNGATENTGG